MPTSIREQVLAAFFVRLQTLTGLVAGVTVERNRDEEVQKFPFVIQIDGGMQRSDDSSGIADFIMTVDVEGYVQAASGAAAGAALSDLYAQVAKAALADLTLGGLAVDITEGDTIVQTQRDGKNKPSLAFSTEYQIRFFTQPADPYTAAP